MDDDKTKPACVLESHLLFLDRLRESGVTNMYGAVPWLEEAFRMKRKDAVTILSYWMRTFSARHPEPEEKK